MENITFEQVRNLVLLVLALLGGYNVLMTAIKNRREEKRRTDAPVNNLEEKVNDHDERLARDHKRLNYLEEAIRILMRSNMAQLSHEINGNSDDKLKASYDEIQQFLIEK